MRSLGMYLHLRCGRTSWRCTTWFRKHMRDGTVGAQRQASMAGDARRHKSVGGHGASHHQQHGAGDHRDVSFAVGHLCLFERSCPSKHLCCQLPRLGALDDCWRARSLGVHSSVAIAHRPGSRAARRCVGVCRSKGVFSAGRQAGAALALRAWQCKTL